MIEYRVATVGWVMRGKLVGRGKMFRESWKFRLDSRMGMGHGFWLRKAWDDGFGIDLPSWSGVLLAPNAPEVGAARPSSPGPRRPGNASRQAATGRAGLVG